MADINSDDLSSKPSITSFQDLSITEAWDPKTNNPLYVTCHLVTANEEVYFGQLFKNKKEITLAEFSSALEHVKDDEVYPKIPNDIILTIAPDSWDDTSAFIKRPGLGSYEVMKGSDFILKQVLNETLIMERVSKINHPNIIEYYGCRVRRGRITGIVLERLDQTLAEYVSTPAFQQLDKIKFFEALESAVYSLHSIGLAHNDLSPLNVMVKNDGTPILIDFGSCQPFGNRLQSLGSEDWREEMFYTSERKHDTYSLNKLRQWIQKPEFEPGLYLHAKAPTT